MNENFNIRNENGYVLVGGLLMLGFLTFLGVTATTTSTLEQQIAGNNKAHTECFYVAEASALEAAQRLELANTEDLEERSADWLNTSTVWLNTDSGIEDDLSYLQDPAYWDVDGEGNDDNAAVSGLDTTSAQLAYSSPVYTVVDFGVADGASLTMTEPTVHQYSTYGMCDSDSEVLIEIGYRRRY